MNGRRFAVLATLAFATPGCTAESRAEAACKARLEEQLVAPASLNIVEVKAAESGPITREDMLQRVRLGIAEDEARFSSLGTADRLTLQYRKQLLRDRPEELLKNVGAPHLERTVGVLIQYDASNALGAPLRSNFFCRVIPNGMGERADVFASFVVPPAEVEAFRRALT